MDQHGTEPKPAGPVVSGVETVMPANAQNSIAAAPMPQSVDAVASTLDPTSVPSNADDADLIEKPWVAAVKRIIHTNQHDPYSQSNAMTLLRKDYMKKRYGEVIKNEK